MTNEAVGELEGVRDDKTEGAREPETNESDHRPNGSIVANLRAAFENDSPDDPPKRAFSGAERRSWDKSREKELEEEIARVRTDLETERELRQAAEKRCNALELEVQDLRLLLKQRRDVSRVDFDTDDAGAANGTARGDAHSLQKQIIDLKRSISTSTRIENQIADSTFAQELGVLHHELQNWVVNHYRRYKVVVMPDELCRRLEAFAQREQLEYLSPLYRTFDPSARLSVYQATAMCYIFEVFKEPLLFGMPSEEVWCQSLARTIEHLREMLPISAYAQWRSLTLEGIRRNEDLAMLFDRAAMGVAEKVCQALDTVIAAGHRESVKTSLFTIVRRAVSLAHLFRVQRPQYDFSFPASGAAFDSTLMEDSSLEHETSPTPFIRCATFPAVLKRGDEHGEQPDLSNVIFKAKVLCLTP